MQSFFNFFPAPLFLNMPTAGIDISDEAIRFVQFEKGKHGLVVKKYGSVELPRGVVESGYISDSAVLVKILSELAKKYGLKYVRASIPEEKVYLFKTSIPKVADREIRTALEFKLEENVPIAPSQVMFDYSVIPKIDTQTLEMSVAAIPQKVVEAYLEVFTKSGMTVLDFEAESAAIARSVIPKGDTGTYMIINFTERQTGIFIVTAGVTAFTSTIPIGGDLLTIALQKNLDISFEEAKALKHDQGFRGGERNSRWWGYFTNTLSALRDEVNKVVLYWQTHDYQNDGKIDKILLCGTNSAIAGFDKYISLGTKTPVEIANVWTNTFSFDEYIPPIEHNEALSFTTPIGLGLKK